jgi:hypothetical protein
MVSEGVQVGADCTFEHHRLLESGRAVTGVYAPERQSQQRAYTHKNLTHLRDDRNAATKFGQIKDANVDSIDTHRTFSRIDESEERHDE